MFAILRQHWQPFWVDIIPAYASLTIVYDVVAIRKHSLSAYAWMKSELEKTLGMIQDDHIVPVRTIQVPVCYDLSFAPDSKRLMVEKKVSIENLIELHTQQTYRVYMIGFLPGFAYMGSVDKRIAMPRLESPHPLVPAGSVGIAGSQTGIYPVDSPGGWNIIGRTPLKIFDADASNPILFQSSDEVRFISISKKEFELFDASTYQHLFL